MEVMILFTYQVIAEVIGVIQINIAVVDALDLWLFLVLTPLCQIHLETMVAISVASPNKKSEPRFFQDLFDFQDYKSC